MIFTHWKSPDYWEYPKIPIQHPPRPPPHKSANSMQIQQIS